MEERELAQLMLNYIMGKGLYADFIEESMCKNISEGAIVEACDKLDDE